MREIRLRGLELSPNAPASHWWIDSGWRGMRIASFSSSNARSSTVELSNLKPQVGKTSSEVNDVTEGEWASACGRACGRRALTGRVGRVRR